MLIPGWATHGPKTDTNSHPHLSQSGNFVLVHNGIIENYLELKEELKKNNIICVSETDTEVIVNTIELNYLLEKNVEKAIEKTLSQLEGTPGDWLFYLSMKQTLCIVLEKEVHF